MTTFLWGSALTKLSQRLPDLSEQSDILALREQQVRRALCVHVSPVCLQIAQATHCLRPERQVGLTLQADVDSAAVAQVLAGYLLDHRLTLHICSCFRPVLLQLVSSLHDQHSELADSKTDLYYRAQVQVLELAPHLEQ